VNFVETNLFLSDASAKNAIWKVSSQFIGKLTSPQPKARAMRRNEKMEMKETKLEEWKENEAKLWEELDKPKEDGKYFKVKDGEPYEIQINGFHLEKKSFEPGGELKTRIIIDLKTVNSEYVKDKIWECGSWTVIKELKNYRGDPNISSHVFFMLRDKDGKNYRYTFKKMRTLAKSAGEEQGVGAQAPASDFIKKLAKDDRTEAFLS
jgi:hypothetical protein